jgi:hypothetical protein
MGATPAATVGALIYTSIKNEGAASPFGRPSPGRFVLQTPGHFAPSSSAPADLTEKGAHEGTSLAAGIVNALGMFWERSKVDWKASQPKLLGQLQGGTIVNFNAQRGVYLLHDTQGVVYVGRVTGQDLGLRLKQHTTDRLGGRWTRFSWFGVYPVDDSGQLKTEANFSMNSIDSTIAAMEAVLIEALAAISHTDRFCVERCLVARAEDRSVARNRFRDGLGGCVEGLIADRSRIWRIAPPI